jgi:hypothetical protein
MNMKTAYLTALSLVSLLIATPALAGVTVSKETNGVKVECSINGSHDDGWSIRAVNNKAKKMTCAAKCELVLKRDSKTQIVEAKSQTIRESATVQMDGGVISKGGFSAAKITEATCKDAS